ncbi:MAG TPA: pyruvate synthase subunit beta [Firmicutes bacterium]|jgi:pyruvate ferredoxin oxidoreductase beta subunit|nr:pyruvate synthase subunit beta [Bacillota bacterium]
MDQNAFVVKTLTKKEYFSAGHRACAGCGEVLAVRLVQKALGRNVIVASATGCMEIVSSPFPLTSWKVPWIHIAFENAAAVASGIEAGLKVLRRKGKIDSRKITVAAMAGDGGTADIGLQALSGALERGHDFVFVCYDNEAYMNTGVQRSSSTPFGASTMTSPAGSLWSGQMTWKKNMPAIAAAHGIPYVATACPSYPLDLITKVKKASAIDGPSYLHILSVCPSGWGIPSDTTVKIGRLAVESGIFPLYEIENGKLQITVAVEKLIPVERYLQPQTRFRHLQPATIAVIRERVKQNWQELLLQSNTTQKEDKNG